MGEIAEMMLDGTCCEGCGEFIGEAVGFPKYCSPACARDRGALVCDGGQSRRRKEPKTRAHVCTVCQKPFGTDLGRRQHEHDKHGIGGKADRL